MRASTLKTIDLFYLFSATILIFYSFYRSCVLSFTHDESYSFLHIIHGTFYQIVSNGDNCWISANNHILNSLCMRYSELFFGPNEFNLRAHSVLAHMIYILFTYLILKEVKSVKFQIIGFVILNFNPYLLDFFSLARGYALSIAFMTMSVYYFIQHTKKETFLSLIICLFSALLATLANFAIITFTASIIILFQCFMLLNRYSIKHFILKNIPVLITVGCLYCLYHWPITELINHGQLFFGGDKGLWEDTVVSSIEVYLYHSKNAPLLSTFFQCLVILMLIAGIVMFFIKIKQKKIQSLDYIFLIVVFIVGINFVQHFFMETSYFRERFAMFLVPLFFISFINLISFFSEISFSLNIIANSVAFAFFLATCFICKDSLNLTHTYNWKYDADTKNMLHDLTVLSRAGDKNFVKLGITWWFEPTINFYIETGKVPGLITVRGDGRNDKYDYFYIDKSENSYFDQSETKLIKSYALSEGTFYKTK